MSEVIELKQWRERKASAVAQAPALTCPTCDTECQAVNIDSSGTTLYRCVGHGHRALSWRIDAEGEMLRGATGKRYC